MMSTFVPLRRSCTCLMPLRLLLRLAACICLLATALAMESTAWAEPRGGPYQATGIKIGEVTPSGAIIWTRLTRREEPLRDGVPFPRRPARKPQIPQGRTIDEMAYSVAGSPGEVRVTYWPAGRQGVKVVTEWTAVDPQRDFTRQFTIDALRPATTYHVTSEARGPGGGKVTSVEAGGFRTAPAPETDADVRFVVMTCQRFDTRDDGDNGQRIYKSMLKLDPDFFVHTGDIVYYDLPKPFATNAELARLKWQRMYSFPNTRAFHNRVASYFEKDDHDTVKNDCWPRQSYGDLTWEQGLGIFREQTPMGEKTYRTYRWGKHLQIWLVEGRDYRSPNTMPDGPKKSIWGKEQMEWFQTTFDASDATFRVLITPTPILGPDSRLKKDNHANAAFRHESLQIRRFLGNRKNTFSINGDRHWQYASVDPETGMREYCTGPSTDAHAKSSSKNIDTEHPALRYFKMGKGGFLGVQITAENSKPVAHVRHYGVDGQVYREDKLTAE